MWVAMAAVIQTLPEANLTKSQSHVDNVPSNYNWQACGTADRIRLSALLTSFLQ